MPYEDLLTRRMHAGRSALRSREHPGSWAKIPDAQEIHAGIDHRHRCPAVERDRGDRVDLEVVKTARREVAADDPRQLQDQVRLAGHLAILARRQVVTRRDLEPLAVGELGNERDLAVLLADQ